jgi:mannose-6-phosphate isomerase-like protein (cupin superfamily)
MSGKEDNTLKLALSDAAALLAAEHDPFITMFERGDARVLLYAPKGEDTQTPHKQDELYVVASGSGTFRRGDETVPFVTGDTLFVAAHVPHCFENFSDDFSTWVVFFGPRQ